MRKVNYKQVIFAREYRGITQTQLAKQIEGLSQSNLSKFEKGLNILSDSIVNKIIKKLDFPKEFFYRKYHNPIELSHYRKRTTINKKAVQEFEQLCRFFSQIVDDMTTSIEWPQYTLKAFDLSEGFTPQKCAYHTRKMLGITKDEPIEDFFDILESNGIIVFEVETDEKIDGVSFLSKKGYPIIVINKNFSNDRKRFTLAHELGHLMMHYDYPIPNFRENEIEKEANAFAGEFLMPSDQIRNSLYRLRLNDLGGFKRYWLTSMKSIIFRAYELGCINKETYTYYNVEFSRMGYNKKEPYEVYIDKPMLFENAYKLFENELSYSKNDLAETFNLPIDIINKVFNFENKRTLRLLA